MAVSKPLLLLDNASMLALLHQAVSVYRRSRSRK